VKRVTMPKLKGIVPAVVTPFDDDFRFCPGAFECLLDRLYGAGIHGVYVCGQSGEGMAQPAHQRKLVAETAIRNSPPEKTVIVHVGTHAGTAEAIDLARHAKKTGASAISSLPPIGAFSFEEVRAYYEALAGASGLPLLLYYFPALSTSIVSLDHFLRLLEIPKVAGLKFTSPDLFKLWQIRKSGAIVFNGTDEMFVAGLLMGANGGIGSFYNLVPELFVEVYELAEAQRWNEAQSVQDRINELIAIGLRYPVHPVVKTLLAGSGIDCGSCVPPRRRLTWEEEGELGRLLSLSSFSGHFGFDGAS